MTIDEQRILSVIFIHIYLLSYQKIKISVYDLNFFNNLCQDSKNVKMCFFRQILCPYMNPESQSIY